MFGSIFCFCSAVLGKCSDDRWTVGFFARFAARLNVLHLHLSDFGRMSLDVGNMTHQRDHTKGWSGPAGSEM